MNNPSQADTLVQLSSDTSVHLSGDIPTSSLQSVSRNSSVYSPNQKSAAILLGLTTDGEETLPKRIIPDHSPLEATPSSNVRRGGFTYTHEDIMYSSSTQSFIYSSNTGGETIDGKIGDILVCSTKIVVSNHAIVDLLPHQIGWNAALLNALMNIVHNKKAHTTMKGTTNVWDEVAIAFSISPIVKEYQKHNEKRMKVGKGPWLKNIFDTYIAHFEANIHSVLDTPFASKVVNIIKELKQAKEEAENIKKSQEKKKQKATKSVFNAFHDERPSSTSDKVDSDKDGVEPCQESSSKKNNTSDDDPILMQLLSTKKSADIEASKQEMEAKKQLLQLKIAADKERDIYKAETQLKREAMRLNAQQEDAERGEEREERENQRFMNITKSNQETMLKMIELMKNN